MVSKSASSLMKKNEALLSELTDKKLISVDKCDTIIKQYEKLLSFIKLNLLDEFSKFNAQTGRLDSLFYDVVGTDDQFNELWPLMKTILTLSHGQASVERGFSVNKDILS